MFSNACINAKGMSCPGGEAQSMIVEHLDTNQSLRRYRRLGADMPIWSDHPSTIIAGIQVVSQDADIDARGFLQSSNRDPWCGANPEFFNSCMVTEESVGTGTSIMSQPWDSSGPSSTFSQGMRSRSTLSPGASLMATSSPPWTSAQGFLSNEGVRSPASAVHAERPRNSMSMHVTNSAGEGVYCAQPVEANLIPFQLPSGGVGLPVAPPLIQAKSSESKNARLIPASSLLSPLSASAPISYWACPQQRGVASGNGFSEPPSSVLMASDVSAAATEFEYEPYNSTTLSRRKVGSLDRVVCALHHKERSAQNMILVHSKKTSEMHWRCKHSSQCKVRNPDQEWTVSDHQGASSVSVTDIIADTQLDLMSVVSPGAVLPVSICLWNGQSGVSQYTLLTPSNGSALQDYGVPTQYSTKDIPCQNILPGLGTFSAYGDPSCYAPSCISIAARSLICHLCPRDDSTLSSSSWPLEHKQ